MEAKNKKRIMLLEGVALAIIAGMLFLDRIPQDPSYHDFADKRHTCGIPNFMDVVSNIFFVMVGAYGLLFLRKSSMGRGLGVIYGVVFTGIALTGIGSAYYHLVPDNFRLVWDRLPMTIVFTSFLSATIYERISKRVGKGLLVPLLILGIASVYWWHYTEQQGNGDLRFYAAVQFLPMLLIPLILLLFPSPLPDPGTKALILVIIFYAIAKVFEHFDDEIFALTGFISGHSLKHIAAAAATWFIVRMTVKRYPDNRISHVQRS
jgi:hypothetical protein